MDFRNAKELLKVCQEQGLSISAVMLQRELTEGEQDPEETDRKMDRVLEIMKSAASTPIHTPVKSMGGLIGGEAKKISDHKDTGKGLCGDLLERAVIYAMATLETNASMGVIVASPTAGSAGIVPGLLLASRKPIIFPMNRSSRDFIMPARLVILLCAMQLSPEQSVDVRQKSESHLQWRHLQPLN